MKFPKHTIIALAATVLTANGLFADVATYEYTGSDFNVVNGAYNTSEDVTATITFAAPLADNLSFETVTPLSLTMMDGEQTFHLGDPGFTATTEFATDGSGNITTWLVGLEGPEIFFGNRNTADNIFTENNPGVNVVDQGQFFDVLAPGEVSYGIAFPTPGTWTLESTAAPEPRMVVVVLIGMLACVGAGRWRNRRRMA